MQFVIRTDNHPLQRIAMTTIQNEILSKMAYFPRNDWMLLFSFLIRKFSIRKSAQFICCLLHMRVRWISITHSHSLTHSVYQISSRSGNSYEMRVITFDRLIWRKNKYDLHTQVRAMVRLRLDAVRKPPLGGHWNKYEETFHSIAFDWWNLIGNDYRICHQQVSRTHIF